MPFRVLPRSLLQPLPRSLPQSRQAIPLVFAFLTLLLTLLATPLFALPREKDRWIELTTENFTLYSNINRSKTMEIAENLEHLRSIFSMNTAWKLQSPLPSRVYIFGSRSEFDPYKPLYQGKPKELAGYFLSHPNGNFIALNGSARSTEQTMATIYHEYLHYLIRNNLQGIPLWLNEGLAEYYSTFRVFKNRADVGLPVRRHLEWVQTYELIPLERLFEISSSSTEYNEGTRRGVFYAQSWALVHYLLRSDPQRAAQLSRFLQLTIDEGRETKAAFLEAFGTDFASLEKEIRRYVRSLLMKYNRIRVDDLPDASIQMRELSYAEVLALLGNLLGHQHQDRSEEAAAHFRAALEREPKNTMALAGMADHLAGKGENEQALALYLNALKDNDDDHILHFRYAEFLLRKARAQGKVDHENAISSLWQSTGIRPDFAPAWRMLTYAYTFEKEPPEEALKVGETAFKLHPGRDDVAHNLLVIYLRLKEADRARHLVANYFRTNATPEQFRRAANDLLNMEMNQVSTMLNERRTEEALAYLEEMLPKALLGEHGEQIQARIAIVRKRIDQM